MNRTVFHIKKMDCPSEERMIRMKLDSISSIKEMSFDLAGRNLSVIHEGETGRIKTAIDSLNMDTGIAETAEYHGAISTDSGKIDKKLLWAVLIINFSFFIIEMLAGYFADSMGLVADSLDMLADALVYGLSLYAISGTLLIKKRVARISGIFQLSLAVLGFAEVFRRFAGFDTMPDPAVMISVSLLALVANTASLIILNRSGSSEVHIRSSQIFTSNDVIANIGVITAGVMVILLNSKIPDLVIGLIVFLLVLRGAFRILQLSK